MLSRTFRQRRKIKGEFNNEELGDLLGAKWMDSIGASLASYESVRRGEKQHLWEVAGNMERFFPDFPDTHAIRRLAGPSGSAASRRASFRGWLTSLWSEQIVGS